MLIKDMVIIEDLLGNLSFAFEYRNKYVPEQVIFQDEVKTTIVIWNDGTKTVVKCTENEEFIPEVGFAMALAKKVYGTRADYLNIVKNATHQKVFNKKEK